MKVAEVEVQGRPAHQLLLAERAPVLGLHSMLGECMNPHLVTLWAQEAAVGTAEHLGEYIQVEVESGERWGTHYLR